MAIGDYCTMPASDMKRTNIDRGQGHFAGCAASAVMVPCPIPAASIIEGTPFAETAEIARNRDGTATVYLWRTTAARFRWHHRSDESVVVLAGEAYVAPLCDGRAGAERRIGPGDVAFFRAGEHVLWRVPEHLTKVSTMAQPAPRVVAVALRHARSVKRQVAAAIASGRRRSSFSVSQGRPEEISR